MSRFDKCPNCGQKGWYIGSSAYDLEHRLHTCKYCKAFETAHPRLIVAPQVTPVYLESSAHVALAVEGPYGSAVNRLWTVTAEKGSLLVAEVYSQENAYLMAAAPALLHALKELVRAADPHTNMSDIPVYDALAVSRRALLLAEPAPAVPADDPLRRESSSTPVQDLDSGNGEGFEQQQGNLPRS